MVQVLFLIQIQIQKQTDNDIKKFASFNYSRIIFDFRNKITYIFNCM